VGLNDPPTNSPQSSREKDTVKEKEEEVKKLSEMLENFQKKFLETEREIRMEMESKLVKELETRTVVDTLFLFD
jgi:hypothetical protein